MRKKATTWSFVPGLDIMRYVNSAQLEESFSSNSPHLIFDICTVKKQTPRIFLMEKRSVVQQISGWA
jgi:hypothetical protein